MKNSTEFRFCYYTSRYSETVAFYKTILQWEEFRSWDGGDCQKGTIFRSPNSAGMIEIEEGTETSIIGGELYIEVEDVDAWYDLAVRKNVTIIRPLENTSYGHRSFKFSDPNGLVIGLFIYSP